MSRSQTPPTLQDVARASGVSTATISRALNDPDKVAKATREKIHAAIDALGYTPNFGARALASNQSNIVGAVIPSLANAMFASGLQAFQEVLSESGVTMLVATCGDSRDTELHQVRSLLAHGASGLLLIGAERPADTTRLLNIRNVPYVLSWCFREGEDQTYVGFDNSKAAAEMAQTVLEHGHRKIGLIAGTVDENDRARDRLTGTVDCIETYGDAARITGTVFSDFRLEYGAEAFGQLMDADEKPTAVICGNDVLAAGAMARARDMGLRVPEDISIVGFDDIGIAAFVSPPLTTVRVPQIEMGREAATRLLSALDGQTEMDSIQLPTEVILRKSLARIDSI